jgi:hypothetical protein
MYSVFNKPGVPGLKLKYVDSLETMFDTYNAVTLEVQDNKTKKIVKLEDVIGISFFYRKEKHYFSTTLNE